MKKIDLKKWPVAKSKTDGASWVKNSAGKWTKVFPDKYRIASLFYSLDSNRETLKYLRSLADKTQSA